MPIQVRFLPDDATTVAESGEPLLKVADRAGIVIPTGCLMGSCHACEVEMNGEEVRSCITALPDTAEITINLFSDPTW
jgi:ferredoxin